MSLLILFNSFDFAEKAEVDKYYPKYYHKMDKVGTFFLNSISNLNPWQGWPTDIH